MTTKSKLEIYYKPITYGFIISFFTFIRFSQPIYIDDIFFLMSSGRISVESGKVWNFFPQCMGGATTIEAPKLLYISFYLRSFLYHFLVENVFFLDLFSIIKSTLIIVFLDLVLSKIFINVSLCNRIGLVSLILVGLNPLFFLINRPESSLILALLSAMYLSSIERWSMFIAFIIVFIFYLQLSLHAQAILWSPVFIAIIASLKAKSTVKYVGSLNIIFLSLLSAEFWSKFYSCDSIPHIKKFYASYILTINDIFKDFWSFTLKFHNLSLDIFRAPYYLFYNTHISEIFVTSYSEISNVLTYAVNFLILIVFFLCFSVILRFLIHLSKLSFKEIKQYSVFFTIIISLVIWAGIRRKHSLNMPLIIFSIIVLVTYAFNDSKFFLSDKLRKIFFVLSTLLFVFSCIVNLRLYTLTYPKISNVAVVTNELEIFRTDYMLSTQKIIPKECNIESMRDSETLLIDEATFFLLPKRPNVFLATYGITGIPNENNLFDPNNLVNYKISKFIVSCSKSFMLVPYSDFKNGDICCGTVKKIETKS